MLITSKLFEAHIASWRERLAKSGGRPYRQNWPGRLFHHAPLENAVEILTSGNLLSRTASAGARKRDVADPNVIATTTVAHDFVRLYFRPRTPTQYHIEGIRKTTDLLRPDVHAPVIVVFVFEALAVLSRPDISYVRPLYVGFLDDSERIGIQLLDQIAVREVRAHEGGLERVIFCCFDTATADLYREVTVRSGSRP